MKALRFASLAGAAAIALSCTDPVLDQRVEAQGNEIEGIEPGPFHRVGQRCTSCHREGGDASGSPFTLAGTIFAQPNRLVGVESVEVRLTDADGTKFIARTNCVGNFFVTPNEWQPRFPLLVEIFKNGVRRGMQSTIGREPDCAGCHTAQVPLPDRFAQMPHVFLFGTDEPGARDGNPSCPVDPVKPGSP